MMRLQKNAQYLALDSDLSAQCPLWHHRGLLNIQLTDGFLSVLGTSLPETTAKSEFYIIRALKYVLQMIWMAHPF